MPLDKKLPFNEPQEKFIGLKKGNEGKTRVILKLRGKEYNESAEEVRAKLAAVEEGFAKGGMKGAYANALRAVLKEAVTALDEAAASPTGLTRKVTVKPN